LIVMADESKSAPTPPERGVVVDPRVLLAGGVVAAGGVALLAVFLWMVPNAADRERNAACAGLRPASAAEMQKEHPSLCNNGNCKYPLPAPDFTALDHNNKPVKLSTFRGKVVLLNFWASWCGVCKTEKPQLGAMAEDLVSGDFETVALASDRNWRDVLVAVVDALAPKTIIPGPDGKSAPADQVFEEYGKAKVEVPLPLALDAYKRGMPDGLPFQVLLDPPAGDDNIGKIAASWGIHAVPESALIDREGNIVAYFINKRDWQSPVAETCLRSVIDGK
jgi:thiol-disulfide isomerase/thioredoxin